jgi:hypothetical protein
MNMKLFVALFALVTLLVSLIVHADDPDKTKEAATTAADAGTKSTKTNEGSADKKGKKVEDEEPDCD